MVARSSSLEIVAIEWELVPTAHHLPSTIDQWQSTKNCTGCCRMPARLQCLFLEWPSRPRQVRAIFTIALELLVRSATMLRLKLGRKISSKLN